MVAIPGIYVAIRGDSSQLTKDLNQAKSIVSSSAKEMSNELNNALSGQQISGGIDSLIDNLGKLNRSSHLTGDAFKGLGIDLGELRKITGLTEAEFAKLQSRILATKASTNQEQALRNIGRSAGLTADEMRAMGSQFGLTAAQIDKVTGGALKAGSAVEELGKKGHNSGALLGGGIISAAANFYILQQTIQQIGMALDTVIFKFNSTMETANLGIGASLLSAGTYKNSSTGEALTGTDSLKAARDDAAGIMKELQAANMQTTATLDQLIRAYQETLPVAMAKGFNKSMVVDFTLAMMQAASVLDSTGALMSQLQEETRSLLTGSITAKNSRIATVLGVTNEDVAKFKGDAQGLFSFLMDKLKAYKLAGLEMQNTWAGMLSNVKDLAMIGSGQATSPVFEGTKKILKEIIDSLVVIDAKTGKQVWSDSYTNGVKELQGVFQGIVDLVERHKKDFGQLFEDMKTGANMASVSIKAIATPIEGIYEVSNKLLGLGMVEWGIIGYALLKGPTGAAGIALALTTLNKQLKEMPLLGGGTADMSLGGLFTKLDKAIEQSKKLGNILTAVAEGKISPSTGEPLKWYKEQLDEIEREKNRVNNGSFSFTLNAPKKDLQAVADAYKSAYGIIGGITQEVYDTMKKQYEADRDAFILLTGDKITAQKQFEVNMQRLDLSAAGGNMNAAHQKQLSTMKAFEEAQAAIVKAGSLVRMEQIRFEYEWGDKALKDYLKEKQAIELTNLDAELAAKRTELQQAQGMAGGLSGSAGGKGAAAKDASGYADAMKSVYMAEKAVTELEGKRNELLLKSGHEVVELTEEQRRGFAQIGIELMNLTGDTVGATKVTNDLILSSKEFSKIMKEADSGTPGGEKAKKDMLEKIRLTEVLAQLNKDSVFATDTQSVAELTGDWEVYYKQQKDILDIQIALANETGKPTAFLKAQKNDLLDLHDLTKDFGKGFEDISKAWRDTAKNMKTVGEECARALQTGFSDIFFDSMQGKFETLGDYINAFMASIERAVSDMISKELVGNLSSALSSAGSSSGSGSAFGSISWGGILSSIGSWFVGSAQGNVFDSPGLSVYSGSIVSKPTFFPFASGIGLMGESGPEAVMPLKRAADGSLGVRAGGQGFNQTVNIVNNTDSKVSTKTSSDGMTMEVLIEQVEGAMSKRMARGTGLAGMLDSRYGRRM